MICDQGDVAIVPFPFVDLAAEKRRPAVVLSRAGFNRANGHSLLAMITTAARSRWPSDIAISDLASAGLRHSCVLRWKVFTLPNDIVLRRAGALAQDDRARVLKAAEAILS